VSEPDVFLTIAEVAVAFAGFASLVGILGHRISADDPLVLGVRMRAMLLSSLTVVAFSIFPVILDRYGVSSDVVWTASSLVLFVVAAGYVSWFTASLNALGQAEISTTRFQRVVILPTLLVTSAILGVLLVANVALANPGIYLTALAVLLFQSGFTFCLIVFSFLPRVDPIYGRAPGDGAEGRSAAPPEKE
jgi:hypothetical protein